MDPQAAYDAIAGTGNARVGEASSFETVTTTKASYQVVAESPEYLAQSAGKTLDEYSLARMVQSEEGGNGPVHMLAVAEAAVNEARRRGRTVTRLLTASAIVGVDGHYSEQAAGKWASTRSDPRERAAKAAELALQGSNVFMGVVDYFSPRNQDAGSQNGHTLRLSSEQYIAERASEGLFWIGPVAGVNPYELMLFSRQPQGTTDAANAVVESGRKGETVKTGMVVLLVVCAGLLYLTGALE